MAKNDYRAVLRDLKSRRAKLDAAIEVMEGILGVGKEKSPSIVEEPIRRSEAVKPVAENIPTAPSSNGHSPTSLMDAAYAVLKEAGEPLHAKQIAERVMAKFGKETTYNSLAASLPKSAGGRFENIGNNTFQLTEWSN